MPHGFFMERLCSDTGSGVAPPAFGAPIGARPGIPRSSADCCLHVTLWISAIPGPAGFLTRPEGRHGGAPPPALFLYDVTSQVEASVRCQPEAGSRQLQAWIVRHKLSWRRSLPDGKWPEMNHRLDLLDPMA
jgi:hypothetical protein